VVVSDAIDKELAGRRWMPHLIKPTILALCELTLYVDERRIVGPNGYVVLSGQPFAIMRRLIQRPDTMVSGSDLITIMYENPDDEAEHSNVVLRTAIKRLRALIAMLGCEEQVVIRTHIGFGYSIGKRTR
jgi:DNA-binding response OmpR family regulator